MELVRAGLRLVGFPGVELVTRRVELVSSRFRLVGLPCIDFTTRRVELVRSRLRLEGLPGVETLNDYDVLVPVRVCSLAGILCHREMRTRIGSRKGEHACSDQCEAQSKELREMHV